jgi:hypothetical protein
MMRKRSGRALQPPLFKHRQRAISPPVFALGVECNETTWGGPLGVESRPGASADAVAPPRFPAPLIKPDVPISSIRLSD